MTPATSLATPTGFLSGGGALAELIRAHDWSATPLGPVDLWPQSLKTTVSLMLNSQHPMWVGWGPEITFLYNDAYISVLSLAKHPWALGRPASEVWAEIWDVCGPLADKVFQRGEASFQDDVRLFMKRTDSIDEVFYSFSYSPIRDESGGVGGLFCPSAETTGKVLGARRLGVLSALAAEGLVKDSVADACLAAMRTLQANPDDVPFALLYMAGDAGLELLATSNVDAGAVGTSAELWRADAVLRSGKPASVSIPELPGLPIGLAGQPVRQVRVLPVTRGSGAAPDGVLVAAISPARPLDRDYQAFFSLVANQLATTIQSARAAEETLARAENLAQLDRAKTVFFSNVSHELRTPLTLMLAPLQEILEQVDEDAAAPPPVRESVLLALRNGRRLHKLVNTLLDFSSIEAGRVRASYVPTDLGALTADLASSFRSAVERAGMTLTMLASPLQDEVYVDREMWEKIVLNLVSNAFKYTLEGGITVAVRQDGSDAVLAVSDTGTGIPPEELPRLFERFHRVEGARGRTHEGTGIGLALVHELVRLHGGAISVTSELGRGSTFEVRIPTGISHLPPERVRKDAGAPLPRVVGAYVAEALTWLPEGDGDAVHEEPAAAPPGQRARVLLADDNADMRAYIARLLVAQGHEVVAVSDGQQALDAARAHRPDLVLTDVMMPVLDGFALLKALREDQELASTPVIMLSARAGEEARVEGLQAGADDYLTKPFSARELSARVESTLAITRVREQALQTERRLRQESIDILESIREGFVALDAGWRITYMNAEAERLNRVRREDVLGRDHWEVYPEVRGTDLERWYRHVMERREVAHFENWYAPWERWFEISCYPMQEGGIAVYYRDVTQRKRSEQLAQEADRRKDEFIATLAHELRNPLAPIRTALQVLQRAGDANAAARMREVMERQVNHMVRLVDDLLDVARISRGKLELRCERVLLADVVQAAVETSKPLLDAGRHELFVSLPHETVALHADATRVAQAIANLLNNAAKYTPDGGRVTLTARLHDDQVSIAVADTGAGISPRMLPYVFEMFMQDDSTLDRAQGGLGIGLTLVKQLVRLHGGEVRAHSEGVDRGSTFTITLPVLAPEVPSQPEDASPAESPGAPSLNVLVADDNVDAAETLTTLLGLMGHRASCVPDGPAAIAAFQASQPDVVLLDIGMPGMDGYEVARRLRELQRPGHKPPRLVALTGWGAANDRARAQEAGFDQHLTKPVDLAALEQSLHTEAMEVSGG